MLLYTHLLVTLIISIQLSHGVKCPCKDASLCKPLTTPARKESFGFSTGSSHNYKLYDWSKLTTLAVFGKWSDEVLCFAHSKNVRVVLDAYMPYNQLTNNTFKKIWMHQQLNKTLSLHADGINIDFESRTKFKSKEYYALTQWVIDAVNLFHDEIPGSQVSIDIASQPTCTTGYCFDYYSISKSVDFLVLMSYDEHSSPYYATANSGYQETAKGIEEYLKLDINKDKLVVALPWYGYNYPCISYINDLCELKKAPLYRRSFAAGRHGRTIGAGRQYDYDAIIKMFLPLIIGQVKYGARSKSPYFHYKDMKASMMHQVWYDDPKSLELKYNYVLHLNLRGLGYFQLDSGYLSQEMWDAIPRF